MTVKQLKLIPLLLVTSVGLAGCGAQQHELDAANNKIAELEATIVDLKKEKQPDASQATAPSTAGSPTVENSTPSSEPSPPPSAWVYNQNEDSMSGKKTYFAHVESSNTVEFSFPYGEPQHGTLAVRDDPRSGKDIIFKIEKGQLLCSSYDGCNVLVRFDGGKATHYSAMPPSDNSSETLFISNYSRFMGNLKKSKIVRISPTVYQEGSPVFEFDVANFETGKFKP